MLSSATSERAGEGIVAPRHKSFGLGAGFAVVVLFVPRFRRPLQLRGREEAEAEAAAHHSRLLLTVTGADIFAEGTATDISV